MSGMARWFGALGALGTGCAESEPDPTEEPVDYVLVHGAWMGAWGWSDLEQELEGLGHRATAVELPAHGEDPASPLEVSLEAYVERVIESIDAVGGPLVLVGHSAGGLVASAAAEQRPEAISRLVYLAAILPTDGQSLFDATSHDTASQTPAALMDDGSDGTLDIRPDALIPLFCADCDAEVAAELTENYREEPSAPFLAPISLTAEAFGSVPRAYLFTTDDQAVTRGFQQEMVDASPVVESAELATGHAPFLSAPAELASALVEVSR